MFGFTEGISFMVPCNTQEEIDYYWNRLTEGGEENMCGWLKDQFGVSWQIVPDALGLTDDRRPRKSWPGNAGYAANEKI